MLSNDALERSPVVANCRMNRERVAAGVNSYERELGFDPVDFLRKRLDNVGEAAWLDLCCGRGRALLTAAATIWPAAKHQIALWGVDLIGDFDAIPAEIESVRLERSTLRDWRPDRQFDLITCVHGLHYLGDKLKVVRDAVSWLRDDGVFVAHVDPRNLRARNNPKFHELALRRLATAGVEFRKSKHLLYAEGRKCVNDDFRFVGADDAAGPNYTGQDAVDSYYDGE